MAVDRGVFCTYSVNIFINRRERHWNNNEKGCHQACSPRLPALLQPAQVERYPLEVPPHT
jgi:hypothetical protein